MRRLRYANWKPSIKSCAICLMLWLLLHLRMCSAFLSLPLSLAAMSIHRDSCSQCVPIYSGSYQCTLNIYVFLFHTHTTFFLLLSVISFSYAWVFGCLQEQWNQMCISNEEKYVLNFIIFVHILPCIQMSASVEFKRCPKRVQFEFCTVYTVQSPLYTVCMIMQRKN